jgi:aminopeptidase N
MNAGRVASSYFGPLPYPRVAITQQSQWTFGQSWPGLIYMPYLAFLASIHRVQLDQVMSGGFISDAQIEHMGYHEYAHQWWGHLVGWDSYRDQWLSEGFAEFTAGLVVEHTKGRDAADAFWGVARDRVVVKPRGARTASYEAGPVSLGYRLSAKDNSMAPGAILYSKGAYILHMLRMLMWENQSQPPDQRFADMMRDFAQSFAGKAATNADFQAVVERHVMPQMDAAGDGSMDWFFDQWLYGTELPSFRNHLEVARVAGDEYRIAGTVEQLGVSETFRTFMPIYLDFGKDGMARLGGVRLVGSGSQDVDLVVKLPAKPKRVVLNAHHDVLALDVR